ncbi:MAG: histidinol-phosphatase [Eubacteriales bacterium]|nr:histidinol-phosphatase [Eubacteriales bacterium]
MRCAVDLHIHSCLSPCGDELMTPNNIVGMSKLKELDMIAVTDHNTAMHLPAVKAVADVMGLAILPGLELTTREEAHLLAYFQTVEEAVAFSQEIYPFLPAIPNKPELFGPQTELNEDDEPVREEPKLLISALEKGVDELAVMITERGGLAVPAHINRSANGILNALGFLPPGLPFAALEVARDFPLPQKGLPDLPHLHSSDAHYLENILEREVFLELEEASPAAFFESIRKYR